MRTTTTLLIAAAALAAAVTSSQAQTVYSQNIVGYVNQVLPGSPNFSLVQNPLQGTTNAAEQVITCVQFGDSVLTWNGTGFNSAIYAPGLNDDNTVWVDANSFSDIPSPQITPGEGVFYENNQGVNETNTYVGTCVLSNTIVLTGSPNFTLVGSTVPIGGDINSTNFNLPVQFGDSVLTWNGTGFDSDIYAPGLNDDSTVWVDANSFADVADPQLSVGQGFFYENNQGSDETWQQNDSYIIP